MCSGRLDGLSGVLEQYIGCLTLDEVFPCSTSGLKANEIIWEAAKK